MIDKLKELLAEQNQDFTVRYEDGSNLSIFVNSDANTYKVIGGLLHHAGVKGEGLCGGGFEVYPMNNGMTFAVAWNADSPDKIYLGKMGCAF